MAAQQDLPGFSPSAQSSTDPHGVRRLVTDLQRAGISDARIRELCAVLLLCLWATDRAQTSGAQRTAGALVEHRRFLDLLASHLASANLRALTPEALAKTLRHLAFTFAASARAPHAPCADCLCAFDEVTRRASEISQAALVHVAEWLAELPGPGDGAVSRLLECFDEVDVATGETHKWPFTPPNWLASLLRDLTSAPSSAPRAPVPDASAGSEHFMTLVAQQMVSELLHAGSDVRALRDLALNAHEFLLGLTRFVLQEQPRDTSTQAGQITSRNTNVFNAPGPPGGDTNLPRSDVVLMNPPFGATVAREHRRRSNSASSLRDPERFFIARILERLAPGGRAAVIVPAGFLYRDGPARRLRRQLVEEGHLEAVISLPVHTFRGAPRVRAAILVLRGRDPELATAVPGTARTTGSEFESNAGRSVLLIDGSQILGPTRRGAPPREPLPNSVEPLVQVVRRPDSAQAFEVMVGSRGEHGIDGLAIPCAAWTVDAKELAVSRWSLSVGPRQHGSLGWLTTPLGKTLEARGEVLPLGACADIWVGLYVKNDHLSSEPLGEEPLGYFRIRDLHDGVVKTPSLWVLLSRAKGVGQRNLLQPRDVLLSRSGTIDKAAVLADGGPHAIAGGGIFVIRVDRRRLDPDFLVAYLHSSASREWLRAQSVRTVQPNLTLATMNRMAVPVPRLDLQAQVLARARETQVDALTCLAEALGLGTSGDNSR